MKFSGSGDLGVDYCRRIKMSLLLVDGYNIINNWPDLEVLCQENLDAARAKLADILDEFVPLLWEKIIIVYDAYQVKGKAHSHLEGKNIKVVFTAEGQTADSFIERLVSDLRELGEEVEVASSDHLEQNLVLWKGGRRISSRELRELLEDYRVDLRKHFDLPPPRESLYERLSHRTRTFLEKWRRR
jgi:predicted RNA-binding protein with PIN domain